MAKHKLLKNTAWFEDGKPRGGDAGQVVDVPDDVLERNPDWFEAVEPPEPPEGAEDNEAETEAEAEAETAELEETIVVDTQQEAAANTQVKRVRKRKRK